MTDSHGSLRRLGRSSLIARASSWFLSALGNPSTLFPTGSLTSAIPVSTWIFPTKKISRKPLKAASLSFYKSVLKYTLYLHSIRNLFIGYKINLPKRIILQSQIPSKASTDAVQQTQVSVALPAVCWSGKNTPCDGVSNNATSTSNALSSFWTFSDFGYRSRSAPHHSLSSQQFRERLRISPFSSSSKSRTAVSALPLQKQGAERLDRKGASEN